MQSCIQKSSKKVWTFESRARNVLGSMQVTEQQVCEVDFRENGVVATTWKRVMKRVEKM